MAFSIQLVEIATTIAYQFVISPIAILLQYLVIVYSYLLSRKRSCLVLGVEREEMTYHSRLQ